MRGLAYFILGVFIGLLIGALMLLAVPAHASSWRQEHCRFQSLQRGVWTQREELRTARCLVRHFPIPGGFEKLQDVIACESGWNRLAYNPSGPYVGLGQHALAYWEPRVDAYTPRGWELKPSWRNSRTMLTITVRMVAAVGWSPWSCA